MNIANLLPIASDERVTSIIRVPEFDEDSYLVMVTRHGIIKRTNLLAYNTARKAVSLPLTLMKVTNLLGKCNRWKSRIIGCY